MLMNSKEYMDTLDEIKQRIRDAQRNALMSVNGEGIILYWNIGRIINERSSWGNKFVENLERDIRLEFPKARGYSARNLRYMAKFNAEYQDEQILHQLGAKLPWRHHTEIMDKVKNEGARIWYMAQVREHGWSRTRLIDEIGTRLYERQIAANKVDNFKLTLPPPQSDLVKGATKDPYVFDFLAGADDLYETQIEQALVDNIAKLILELGTGFAFAGNQFKIVVSGKEYFLDMLFYNFELRCFVVVELKNAEFEPRDAGQLNFYLSAVDSQLKHSTDNPTIGLLLCRKKDNLTAEYALRDMNKPMGVSEYKLQSKLPKNLADILPSAEDIKARIKID